MSIGKWSTSASGNASVAGINFAEGQAPSTVNNSARELMAQIRSQYTPSNWLWIDHSASISVNTQTVVKIAGDLTTTFTPGRRLRISGGSATIIRYVESASYTSETTLTLRAGSSLSASMSTVAFSAADAGGGTFVAGSVAELQALTTDVFDGDRLYLKSYYTSSSYADSVPKGGGWLMTESASSSPSNGVTTFVDASSRMWRRDDHRSVWFSQAGCYVDADADDITGFNRIIDLINLGRIEEAKIDPGTMYIHTEPTGITRGNFTIRGLGIDTSIIRVAASATVSVGQVFRFGTLDSNVARATIRDFSIYADNAPDGTDAAIWFDRATSIFCENVFVSGFPQLMRFGGDNSTVTAATTVYEDAQRITISNCQGGPGSNIVDGTPIFKWDSATGCVMVNCFWSGTGSSKTNTRIMSFAPTNGGAGIDGNLFSNNVWNFQNTDFDYGFVFDSQYPSIANTRFANNTMDGGMVSSLLFVITATSSASVNGVSETCRISNMSFTGNRITGFRNTTDGGGGAVEIQQKANRYIHNIAFNGNIFLVGADQDTVKHTRWSGVNLGRCGFTFNGNTFGNAYENGDALNKTRNVFSLEGDGFVITGNRVGTSSLQTESVTGANFFTNFVKFNSATAYGNVITGNDVAKTSATAVANVATLAASFMDKGPVISNNVGKPEGAIRELVTTNTTTTTLGQMEISPSLEYLIKGDVMAKRGNTDRAWYAFEALTRATASGSATIIASTVTAKYESDTNWSVSIDNTSVVTLPTAGTATSTASYARVRVTGSATVTWGLYDLSVKVRD